MEVVKILMGLPKLQEARTWSGYGFSRSKAVKILKLVHLSVTFFLKIKRTEYGFSIRKTKDF